MWSSVVTAEFSSASVEGGFWGVLVLGQNVRYIRGSMVQWDDQAQLEANIAEATEWADVTALRASGGNTLIRSDCRDHCYEEGLL